MNEENDNDRLLEALRQQYREGLPGFLESIDELGDGEPLPPEPYSLGLDDERTFEELSVDELKVVREELHRYLGINLTDPNEAVRRYFTFAQEESTVPGEMQVKVKKTNREGIFLQEMRYEDNALRWVVGPDRNI